MTYGDAEPEDAWHPDDPLPVLLDNLSRRVAALGEQFVVAAEISAADWVDQLEARLERIRSRSQLSDMDHVRIAMIAEDLEHVRYRLRDG